VPIAEKKSSRHSALFHYHLPPFLSSRLFTHEDRRMYARLRSYLLFFFKELKERNPLALAPTGIEVSRTQEDAFLVLDELLGNNIFLIYSFFPMTTRNKQIKNFTLSFGPQHPATHGVSRLVLEMNREVGMGEKLSNPFKYASLAFNILFINKIQYISARQSK